MEFRALGEKKKQSKYVHLREKPEIRDEACSWKERDVVKYTRSRPKEPSYLDTLGLSESKLPMNELVRSRPRPPNHMEQL